MAKNIKISMRQRIFLLCAGFITAFLLLELWLQLASFNNTKGFLPEYDFNEIKSGELVLFCLGDSYTYGSGAGFENSYPVQMQQLFNDHFKGPRVRVFNLGVPGYDSTEILEQLKRKIKDVKPNVVIVICGKNDYWKFSNLSNEDRIWLMTQITSLVAKGRIFKFMNVVFENITRSKKAFRLPSDHPKVNASGGKEINRRISEEFIEKANISREEGLYAKAQSYYEQSLASYPGYKMALLEQGRCHKLSGDFNEAVEVLLGLLVKNPEDEGIHRELKDSLIRSKDMQKMLEVYLHLYKQFPRNDSMLKGLTDVYVAIGGENLLNSDADRAKQFFLKALVLDVDNQHIYKNMLRDITIYKRLYANLGQIADVCKREKILLIFSGYPSSMTHAMQQFAENKNALLINLRPYYEMAKKKFPDRQYVISESDSHCTKEGYYIMAQVIKNKIIELMEINKNLSF